MRPTDDRRSCAPAAPCSTCPAPTSGPSRRPRRIPADALILDLEDAVAPDAKADARDRVCAAAQLRRVRRPRSSPSASTASTPSGTTTTCAAAAAAGPAARRRAQGQLRRRGRTRSSAARGRRRPRPHHASGRCSRRRSRSLHAVEIATALGAPHRAGHGHQRPGQGAPRRARARPAAAAVRASACACSPPALAGKVILDGVYNDIKDAEGFRGRVRAGPPSWASTARR